MSCEREALKVFSDFTAKERSSVIRLQLATSYPERAFCVLAFDESKYATDVQRKFRTACGKEAPSRKAIYDCHNKFVTTGCLCPRKRSGRAGVSEENVQRVRETFSRQSAHRWLCGCQPHAPAALYPQENSWYSILLEAESTPVP
jgi:hypothetical protein